MVEKDPLVAKICSLLQNGHHAVSFRKGTVGIEPFSILL